MNYLAAKVHILQRLENELSDHLYYHGLHHTLDVLAVVNDLCVLERVSDNDQTLVRTAALYHDAGFLINAQEHEQLGCGIVRDVLPTFGYTPKAIDQICGMIMATKIPQSPKTHLEEILCDADLDYLGRDDFEPIALSLFQELKEAGVLSDEQAWNRIQVSFIEKHHFHTKTNIQRREATKQKHLNRLKKIVAGYPTE